MAGPTLQTIADGMGVSRMTVSRALRNDPSIPERTASKIRAEAKRQGYRPDPLVSALMTRLRTNRPHKENPILAYLDTVPEKSPMSRFNYLKQIRFGSEQRAIELGYRFQNFNLPKMGVSEERIGKILYSRGIRGVLISPMSANRPFKMDFSSFAAATVGSSVTEPELHRSESSNLRNYQIALEEMGKLGCRRIGLVLEHIQDKRAEFVVSAIHLRYQSQIKKRDRVPMLIVPKIDKESFFAWLDQNKPEAVVGFSHETNWWLRLRGGNYSRPIEVNLNWQLEDGSDFGIDQQMDLVGAAATDLVVEQLQSNQYGVPAKPKTVYLVGRWVETVHHTSAILKGRAH